MITADGLRLLGVRVVRTLQPLRARHSGMVGHEACFSTSTNIYLVFSLLAGRLSMTPASSKAHAYWRKKDIMRHCLQTVQRCQLELIEWKYLVLKIAWACHQRKRS